jgi:hypothetical protein
MSTASTRTIVDRHTGAIRPSQHHDEFGATVAIACAPARSARRRSLTDDSWRF